jgi:hypothetical protein
MISKQAGRLKGLTGALALMLAFAATAAGKIKIHMPPLPRAEATAPYPAQTFTADDAGATCCTWTSSGNLDGLTLSPAGVLSGTPTAAGSFPFTVTATDSKSASETSGTLTLTVMAGPGISPASLPAGKLGDPYAPTLSGTGGRPGYTFSLTGGLPAGVKFNNSTGAFSGTPGPGTAGSYPITVQVTDSAGGSFTQGYTIVIVSQAPVVNSATLPQGEVTVAYSTTLTESGGAGPNFTWSLATGSGPLPAGVSLSPAGVISGTPTQSGSFPFSVQVTDSASMTSAPQAFTLTVIGGLSITTTSPLPAGEIKVPYSQTLTASGGTPPYTWSVSAGSSLPSGLTLSSTGAISGLPSSSGSFSITIQVADNASPPVIVTKQFTLNVTLALTITTAATLPSGAVGNSYFQALSGFGGAPPYTFTVVSGTLPGGVNLTPGGVIRGTPASSGTFNFTIQVKDSNASTASRAFSLTVVSGLAITTAVLPGGAVNNQYSQPIVATGGTPPYTWALAQGTLPPGLALSAGPTELISGKPTSNGTFTFSVQVTDHVGSTSTKQFTLTIVAGLTITSLALPQGTLGQAYGPFTVAQVGGTLPYTWSVSSGSLGPGLLLSSSGVITGTPTQAGAFNFTLQVKDGAGASATKTFTISVVPPSVPQVNVSGVPPSSPAAQQISFSLSLTTAYPLDITGDITLSFQPDAVAPAVDPALQFSSGGTTASFTIPANSTSPVAIALQTGTVSGIITLTYALRAGGADLPVFESTITIPRSAPVIQSVKLVRTSAGMEVHVVGFSPSRDLTAADLTFTAAPGSSLQTTSMTENLTSVASAWYASAGSAQYGSQLMLVLPFTASQGSADAVGSVSVVMKNDKGTSRATSGTF